MSELPSFLQYKKKLESHKIVCENINFFTIIPSAGNEMLQINQYQKSDKAPSIIYADLEYITENIYGFKNNPENVSTVKVVKIFYQVFQCLQFLH